MHRVEQARRLHGAVTKVTLVALERQTAANIDVPQVEGRMPVDDPVGENLARSARRLNADRVEARRHVQAAQLRGFAKKISIIRREALRTVEEHLDAGRFERGHAMHGRGEQWLDVSEVRRQLIEGEALRYAVLSPGLGVRLEPTDQELAGVLLEI